MEERKTVFDYIGQVFATFGMTVMILNVFCCLVGEEAKGSAAIFSLGAQGLGADILNEFFLISVLIVGERFLFFTDVVLKKMSVPLRTAGMFATVIVSIVACSAVFGWFPIGMWQAWAGFFVSFFVCAGVSVVVTVLRERTENRRMEEALRRLKKEMDER